jgi:hypothetical protein
MSSRKGFAAILLAFALVLLTAPTGVLGASVSEVTHEPAIPKSGEGVDLTLKFSDVSNVTKVTVIYCTIEPFECELPQVMTRNLSDDTIFTYTITNVYEPGTRMGFKFVISFDDRPNENFPKSEGNSSLHVLDGPFEGSYYFTYALESEPTQDLTLFLIVLVVLIAAFIPLIIATVILMKKRKAKGNRDEDEK